MNSECRELRTAGHVSLQSRADGLPMIVGYAAVFYDPADPGTQYQLYDDIAERIMPGAFARALREDDVRGLFNHGGLPLGRTGAGTMRLSVDAKGLRYEIDPPDTQAARDLLASLARGDVTGSSFSFVPRSTTIRADGGMRILERKEVRLFDVGPVTFPAYTSTAAAMRWVSDRPDLPRQEVEEWARGQAAKVRAARAAADAAARSVDVAMALAACGG